MALDMSNFGKLTIIQKELNLSTKTKMSHFCNGVSKEVEILIVGPLEHGLKLAAGNVPIRILEDDGLPEVDPDLVIIAGLIALALNNK